ncbi:Eco57I restriction-modification methylase domain-containing protein [Rhodospirillum rubrum]|uniref:site-specific DNA-methyltransferase (adenine-specific) n=1 Tax=Rhodospirillum rubrum (strain ATCC 11170 / ATH 1.1.1 / DSM 467 / LMG 4362 / NCIMB 8255 / S1) TaxID=269796 RepID=Q2RRF7_RHORT|nr:N-6 DNA methylase [Rhodospirillum rubrum]ABC23288.1 Putative RNA methylase [Rhodospirillum rubrum ATCC 11170]AEO49020.1 putative RNA methylase [Rhodospirillum rubrum F11]MBK5954958.1 SAM-dependent methyltransferase [Rhodospirillum rubrum]QXG79263.1 N-6 DNA methylase [Rhodospirillum rubrum]HCF16930.1 SAM-dependent methyltransferase [Rhodospirillum rubrum]
MTPCGTASTSPEKSAAILAGPPSPGVEGTRSDLARARVVARAWAETLTPARRADQALLFTTAAMAALRKGIGVEAVARPGFARPRGRLDHAGARVAQAIGEDAALLPLAEALHLITGLYPALLPARERGALGAFYTPIALVERLLDRATEEGADWAGLRLLDPAAGGGAFLLGAVARIRAALAGCEPAFILGRIGARVLGLEVDARAAALAQAALDILLADLAQAAGRPPPVVLRVADTLEIPADPSFDLVVGNPPYGRVGLTPAQRARFGRGLYGHANLYGVFTDIALRWTAPGGLIAYLTPTSFLAGRYYGALRGLLAAEAPPLSIDFVHARQGVFEDVLQETLLALYRRGGQAGRVRIHYLTLDGEGRARIAHNGTIGLPADAGAPWLAPRDPGQGHLVARVEAMGHRLAEWGYGVSTGPLVWNRYKGQLRDRPTGKRVHPLIWAEAVTADGRFVFRAAKRNHAPYFKLQAGDDALLVGEPCVLVQRTTAKEQHRRLIAAELPAAFVAGHGGVVVENHLNMVRAKGTPRVAPAVVAALLNSAVVDQVFRCMSGSVAVSAFELEALPLPAAGDLGPLTALVAAGAPRDDIEAECARLYGKGL